MAQRRLLTLDRDNTEDVWPRQHWKRNRPARKGSAASAPKRSSPSARRSSSIACHRCSAFPSTRRSQRSEEHTSELQSPCNLVCRLLLEKKKKNTKILQQEQHIDLSVDKRV